MKVAIIGASGKTGTRLVRESLRREYQVVAVCRTSSADRLKEFVDKDEFNVFSAPEVSDEAMREATGKSWNEWCDLIDAHVAPDDDHPAIPPGARVGRRSESGRRPRGNSTHWRSAGRARELAADAKPEIFTLSTRMPAGSRTTTRALPGELW